MHIIFGTEQAQEMAKKYTVLELDTFLLKENDQTVTAYCTVESIPFDELPNLSESIAMHEHLILNYRGRAWQDCLEGIDQLMGLWRGELDSFYQDLAGRVKHYQSNPPTSDWSPVIQK